MMVEKQTGQGRRYSICEYIRTVHTLELVQQVPRGPGPVETGPLQTTCTIPYHTIPYHIILYYTCTYHTIHLEFSQVHTQVGSPTKSSIKVVIISFSFSLSHTHTLHLGSFSQASSGTYLFITPGGLARERVDGRDSYQYQYCDIGLPYRVLTYLTTQQLNKYHTIWWRPGHDYVWLRPDSTRYTLSMCDVSTVHVGEPTQVPACLPACLPVILLVQFTPSMSCLCQSTWVLVYLGSYKQSR